MAEKKEFSEEYFIDKIQELDQKLITAQMLSDLTDDLYQKKLKSKEDFEHFCTKVELAKIRCKNSGMTEDEKIQFVLNGFDTFINSVNELI